MLIDRTHKPWAIASAVNLGAAIVVYIPYAMGSRPPSGGSALGLIYGTIGFGFMAFVTLLALRKKFPIWRIGRTKTWMRGHLWLGALCLPLILLHAGFLWGHGLTSLMMWLFVVVYASGFFGAWLGGRVYDASQSYAAMWAISIGLGVASVLLNLPIRDRAIEARWAAA